MHATQRGVRLMSQVERVDGPAQRAAVQVKLGDWNASANRRKSGPLRCDISWRVLAQPGRTWHSARKPQL